MYSLIVFAAALTFASAGIVYQPTVLTHSAPLVPVLKTGVVAIQPAPVVPVVKTAHVVPVLKTSPVVVAHPVVPVVKTGPVITKTIQSQSIVHPSPVLIH